MRWIIAAAVVIAALTLLTTLLVPKTFSSSVRVILNASPVSGSSVADLALASNNLAAQYAQLVNSQTVLEPAAVAAGISAAELNSHTTSSTLAGQNIVSITVQASEPARAQLAADALGASLTKTIADQGSQRSEDYRNSVIAQLAPLDSQITQARKTVNTISAQLAKTDKSTAPQAVSAAGARLGSAQSLLSSLNDRRANLATQATLQAISLAPQSEVLGAASAPVQVEPRPVLYTLLAGLLGLVLAAQITVVMADRRQRRLADTEGLALGAPEQRSAWGSAKSPSKTEPEPRVQVQS